MVELDWLEGALGIVISIYGATSFINFQHRDRIEKRLEQVEHNMGERLDDLAKRVGTDDQALWSELTAQRRDTAAFQQQVLRDMAHVATRDDLRAHEDRMTAALRDTFGRKGTPQ